MSQLKDLLIFKRDLEKLYEFLTVGKFSIGEFISTRSNLVLSAFIGKHHLPYFQKYGYELVAEYATITEANTAIINRIADIIVEVGQHIDNFVNVNYDETFHAVNITEPVVEIDPENKECTLKLKSRLEAYSDWHYPALQLNAKYKKYINYMVTCEPLYLAVNYGYINVDELISNYHADFRARLRIYDVNRVYEDGYLPKEQFSFILAWDAFTYLHTSRVKYHLENLKKLLRPGGVIVFNYNNCEILDSIDFVDNKIMSYSTKSIMQKLCDELDYKVIDFSDEPSGTLGHTISWAEIKKPGTLRTTKANPAIGNIRQK